MKCNILLSLAMALSFRRVLALGMLFLIVTALTLVLILPEKEVVDVPFTTIRKGPSAISTETTYLISDLESWQKLWTDMHRNIHPPPELLSIDFTTELVFAVFQGRRSSGGGVEIRRIALNRTSYSYTIYVDQRECPNQLTVETRPCHVVKISRLRQELPEFRLVINFPCFEQWFWDQNHNVSNVA